ncbi:MAG TPA: GntR family transcriptional regulator [Microbacteriaceae bacterium]|nr:GntR family transcriptional regulator [Microbacteriaceae bacterium]
MLISIDPNEGPVYDQIADAITARIATGDPAQGERLPAARDLADALGINVHTVLHAYQRLRDDGLIELRRGRGAVVIGQAAAGAVRDAAGAAVRAARTHGLGEAALIALIREGYRA